MKKLFLALFLALAPVSLEAQQINVSTVPLGNMGLNEIKLTGVVANTSFVIPANAYIQQVLIQNTTANAVTGGVVLGTTSAGLDVATAVAIGANAITFIPQSVMLKPWFSTSAPQTVWISTATLWNSASLTVLIVYGQLSS